MARPNTGTTSLGHAHAVRARSWRAWSHRIASGSAARGPRSSRATAAGASSGFRASSSSLIQLATEEASTPLAEEQSNLHRELNGIGQAAVNAYWSARCKTKKAEWEELTRLGMFSASQATYLRRRREPPTVGAIVQSNVEPDWIVANAPSEPQRVRAQGIIQRLGEIKAEMVAARQHVVKGPLVQTTP